MMDPLCQVTKLQFQPWTLRVNRASTLTLPGNSQQQPRQRPQTRQTTPPKGQTRWVPSNPRAETSYRSPYLQPKTLYLYAMSPKKVSCRPRLCRPRLSPTKAREKIPVALHIKAPGSRKRTRISNSILSLSCMLQPPKDRQRRKDREPGNKMVKSVSIGITRAIARTIQRNAVNGSIASSCTPSKYLGE